MLTEENCILKKIVFILPVFIPNTCLRAYAVLVRLTRKRQAFKYQLCDMANTLRMHSITKAVDLLYHPCLIGCIITACSHRGRIRLETCLTIFVVKKL